MAKVREAQLSLDQLKSARAAFGSELATLLVTGGQSETDLASAVEKDADTVKNWLSGKTLPIKKDFDRLQGALWALRVDGRQALAERQEREAKAQRLADLYVDGGGGTRQRKQPTRQEAPDARLATAAFIRDRESELLPALLHPNDDRSESAPGPAPGFAQYASVRPARMVRKATAHGPRSSLQNLPIVEISVYISSPCDVAAERQLVKRIIHEINSDARWQGRCALKTIAHEDQVPPMPRQREHRLVDELMRGVGQADIMVCILGNRMGTKTVDESTGSIYPSGTAYELHTALHARMATEGASPHILVFLGSREFPAEASDEQHEQLMAVRAYKRHLKEDQNCNGLWFEYKGMHQFEHLMRAQLNEKVERFAAAAAAVAAVPAAAVVEQPPGAYAYLTELSENYHWLKLQDIHEAGTLTIELEKVYVALRAELDTDYERQQAADLHGTEVRESHQAESLDAINPAVLDESDAENIRKTYRQGRDEARQARATGVRTLGDAVRQHHRIVILGKPGSGKTTLGRWFSLQMARAYLRELDIGQPQRVTVSQAQVNPDAPPGGEDLVDLGPARLPIFLRLAHFARELSERSLRGESSLELEDYLGLDPDTCGFKDGLTPQARNQLFAAHLERKRAVVVLDGLDELPEGSQVEGSRRSVVLKVQTFIKKHMPSAVAGTPGADGGNQVIVTSRYIGYKPAPVRAECVHFGILQMTQSAVERFAHSWTDAVNAQLATRGDEGIAAEKLIAEIYDPSRPAVRELATNPLLVTILATVYWKDGKLPDQRAGVYDRVVENLLRIWLLRKECRAHQLNRDELVAALQPLAADMQESAHSSGLISLGRIGELIEGPLAEMRRMKPSDGLFRRILSDLLSTIPKHVGLLAEQSSGNYAFFHRTFQEFLAARHLLADRPKAAARIAERLDDPIWREPLMLALGLAMLEFGPETRIGLLTDVLAADDPQALVPRAALLLVNALPDLREVPGTVVNQIVIRLLTSYDRSLQQERGVGLREQIEQSFVNLCAGRHAEAVIRQMSDCIRRSAGHDLSGATAHLLRRTHGFNAELIEGLIAAVNRDRPGIDWPIRRSLQSALGRHRADLSPARAAPGVDLSTVVGTYLPMRRLLESKPELLELVRRDHDWLCLLVALYGGLGHLDLLEPEVSSQQNRLKKARSAALPVNLASHLDGLASSAPPLEFSPQDVVSDLADPSLSRMIQRHLSGRGAAADLGDALRQRWNGIGSVAARAEALLGLAALGVDVVPLLRAELARHDDQSAAVVVLSRFDWLRASLREPLLRVGEAAARTIPPQATEQQQLDLLRIVIGTRLAVGGSPLPVSDRIPEYSYVSCAERDVRSAVASEYWSWLLSGSGGPGTDSAPRGSPTSPTDWPFQELVDAWSEAPWARNHWAARRLRWSQPLLPPRADTPAERYLAMLEGMRNLPAEQHGMAGCVLGRCLPLLDQYPSLAWETLAVCWELGQEFQRAFLTAGLASDAKAQGSASPHRRFADASLASEALLSLHADATDAEQIKARVLGCVLPDVLRDGDELRWPLPHELFSATSHIEDPYLQFRARFRLQNLLAGEDEHTRSVDVLTMALQIMDPHCRVRAVEWCLTQIKAPLVGPAGAMTLLAPALADAVAIADPENRARALCRLTLLIPGSADELLGEALRALAAMTDRRRQAETIREARAVFGQSAEVCQALDQVAQDIRDPWERDKALDRDSRLIRACQAGYSCGMLLWRLPKRLGYPAREFRLDGHTGVLQWTVMYLGCVADEVGKLVVTPASAVSYWDQLSGPNRRASAIALAESGIADGIPVSAREASLLDRVVQSGHAAELDVLWPYLERPDPLALGVVSRWAVRGDSAGAWSALVQAEWGMFGPEIVAAVIEILANSTDRLRLRAALALHGTTPNIQNFRRRWSVRRIGAETLNVLARCAVQGSHIPSVRSAMHWTLHDIEHDDPTALRNWLEQAAIGGGGSPAAWILKSLESVHVELVPILLSALPSVSEDLQRTLLFGLARLAHCSPTFKEAATGIHAAVAKVPAAVRADVYSLANGAAALLDVVQETIKASEPGDRLDNARRRLDSKMRWLDERSLADDKTCVARLSEIGDGCYINIESYWSNANKSAKALAENAAAVDLLISWVASIDSMVGAEGTYAQHVLTATEAVARLSPDAFAIRATPRFWEPVLTEWVQYGEHWAARMAAVRLLGRLRCVTERVSRALWSAMNDVSFVQQAAFASASEFRRIEGDVLPELLKALNGPDAGVTAATATLLGSIAGAEVATSDRRRILRGLEQAAARVGAMRPIYLMDDAGVMSIRFVDHLDRILYRAVFDINGL